MSMHERDVFRHPSSREQQEKEEAERMNEQQPQTEDETKAEEKDK